MSQTTFDDDELFGEAASEVREDVEASLAAAREELPAPEDVWETDADNVLGVLNALRSATDPGDAEAHLRDAKKWYTMGERADAFEGAEDLAAEIEAVGDVLGDLEAAHDGVGDLAATVPELRSALEAAEEAAETRGAGDEAGEADDAGAEEGDDDATGDDSADGEAAADGGQPADDGESPGEDEQATLDGDD